MNRWGQRRHRKTKTRPHLCDYVKSPKILGFSRTSLWRLGFCNGAELQQTINDTKEPPAFFLKKISLADAKYSAFDRELLAIYLDIEHFRFMIEAHVFTVFTDHEPVTFALQQ